MTLNTDAVVTKALELLAERPEITMEMLAFALNTDPLTLYDPLVLAVDENRLRINFPGGITIRKP